MFERNNKCEFGKVVRTPWSDSSKRNLRDIGSKKWRSAPGFTRKLRWNRGEACARANLRRNSTNERTNERPNLRVVTQDFTVSPRCKSTVITMSLHRVTRIRSSNRASASVRAACVHMESSRFRPRSLPNVSLRATYLAHRLRYSKPSEDFILACAYFACSSINYTTSRNVPLLKLERIDVFVAQELQRRREIN